MTIWKEKYHKLLGEHNEFVVSSNKQLVDFKERVYKLERKLQKKGAEKTKPEEHS